MPVVSSFRAVGCAWVFGAALVAGAIAAPAAKPPVALLESWLLPRYAALTQATEQQARDWSTFCAAPAVDGVERLKADVGAVWDAWAQVSFITFGPVGEAQRGDHFDFYPDRRHLVARAIADALETPDPQRLAPAAFGHTTAALQGLPALEQVLFDPGADAALLAGPQAERRCQLGTAIARNLDTIAAEVRSGWGDSQSGVLGALKRGTDDPSRQPAPAQLLGLLLTDLAGTYQATVDLNLLAVLGPNLEAARPLAAEGRRSGREARIVRLRVASANEVAIALAQGLPAPAQAALAATLAAAQRAADNLPADLGAAAADPARRPRLTAAVVQFRAAQRAIVDPLAARLGVLVGFNRLDGD